MENELKYVNSHIQINKALQKQFSFKKGENYNDYVYILNLKNNKIEEKDITILNTEYAYYEPEIEEKLGRIIESPFFNLLNNKIFNLYNKYIDKQNIIITEKEAQCIYHFFECSQLRGNVIYFFNIKIYNDIELKKKKNDSLREYLDNIDNNKFRLFNDYYLCIGINNTTANFVIPSNVIYSLKEDDNKYPKYYLPVNDKTILIMIHKDDLNSNWFIDNNEKTYSSINEYTQPEIIRFLNKFALINEQNTNNNFIIGNKEELKYLNKVIGNGK